MKVLQVLFKKEISSGGPYQVANFLIRDALKIRRNIITKSISLNFLSYFHFLNPQKLYYFLNKYHLIHIHEIWSLKILLLSIYIRRLGIPYIIMTHGVLNSWSLKKNFLIKIIYAKIFLRNFFMHFIFSIKKNI
jgi:glycosyltransferase involved in cell wall biosynthesis